MKEIKKNVFYEKELFSIFGTLNPNSRFFFKSECEKFIESRISVRVKEEYYLMVEIHPCENQELFEFFTIHEFFTILSYLKETYKDYQMVITFIDEESTFETISITKKQIIINTKIFDEGVTFNDK